MNCIRKKLHSDRGASMAMALVYFLICLTVGGVVLTAAVSNVSRVERNRQEQQEYLAVASASQLLSEDIPRMTFTGSYDTIVTKTFHPAVIDTNGVVLQEAYTEENTTYAKDPVTLGGGAVLKQKSDGTMALPLDQIYYHYGLPDVTVGGIPFQGAVPSGRAPGGGADDHWYTVPMKLEVTASGMDDFPSVQGAVSLCVARDDKNTPVYTLEVRLWYEPSAGSSETPSNDAANVTVLRFEPEVRETSQRTTVAGGAVTTVTTTKTTVVTWKKTETRKGADA